MSVTLKPGFQGFVEIKDEKGKSLYRKSCSSEDEVKTFIQQYGKSKDGWSLIQGTLCPLRTQNFKNFSQDFFLPTFVHYSFKINNIALKVIASTFAIALDGSTFIIRCCAAPIRLYYNHKHPEAKHPIENLSNADSLGNVVFLEHELHHVQINPSPDNETLPTAKKSIVKGVQSVALKKMPGGIKRQSSEEQQSIAYLGVNGKWLVQDTSRSGGTSNRSHAF